MEPGGKIFNVRSVEKAAAEAFSGWGNPTAACITQARNLGLQGTLVASGGLKNGVDAAKAIALGADLAGFGRKLLHDAVHSVDALLSTYEQTELELKIAMFGIGAKDLSALKQTPLLKKCKPSGCIKTPAPVFGRPGFFIFSRLQS